MAKTHYFQLCRYQTKSKESWKAGIAKVAGFDANDVEFILTPNGTKVKTVWDYQLISPSFFDVNVGIEITDN